MSEMSLEHYNKMAERLTELEYLLAERQWIPCSERLPVKYGKYLVTVTSGSVDVAYYEKPIDVPWFYYSDSEDYIGVDAVAWMPLPEPYEGGEEDE